MTKEKSKKKPPTKRNAAASLPPQREAVAAPRATQMTEQQAVDALARATTAEQKLDVIRAYGGVPVRASERWREYLPLPAI